MIYNGHEILLRKDAKVDYTLDEHGVVIAQDQTHIGVEGHYVVRGWNPNPFNTLDEIKNAIDENNTWRYNEQIALIALDILGSFSDEYTLEVIEKRAKEFKFFLEFKALETIVADLKEYLDDYAPDYLRENDEENALSQILNCYDNGGKTADRYCVVTTDTEGEWNYIISLSHNCDMPNGVAMTGLGTDGNHLGKKVDFYQLPEVVQTKVIHMLNYVEA